jgi:hypothetical protein
MRAAIYQSSKPGPAGTRACEYNFLFNHLCLSCFTYRGRQALRYLYARASREWVRPMHPLARRLEKRARRPEDVGPAATVLSLALDWDGGVFYHTGRTEPARELEPAAAGPAGRARVAVRANGTCDHLRGREPARLLSLCRAGERRRAAAAEAAGGDAAAAAAAAVYPAALLFGKGRSGRAKFAEAAARLPWPHGAAAAAAAAAVWVDGARAGLMQAFAAAARKCPAAGGVSGCAVGVGKAVPAVPAPDARDVGRRTGSVLLIMVVKNEADNLRRSLPK